MTSPSPTYEDMIARLERASGPDRELDIAITELMQGHPVGDRGTYTPYTHSLDAAVTLVPEGFEWSVSSDLPRYGATCGSCAADFAGATAPLALCIASLKGRALKEREGA